MMKRQRGRVVGCGGTGRGKVRRRRAVGGSLVFAKLETKKSRPKAAARLCFNDFGHFIVSNPDIGQIVALR